METARVNPRKCKKVCIRACHVVGAALGVITVSVLTL
jgi:hypothetical protein